MLYFTNQPCCWFRLSHRSSQWWVLFGNGKALLTGTCGSIHGNFRIHVSAISITLCCLNDVRYWLTGGLYYRCWLPGKVLVGLKHDHFTRLQFLEFSFSLVKVQFLQSLPLQKMFLGHFLVGFSLWHQCEGCSQLSCHIGFHQEMELPGISVVVVSQFNGT